MFRRLVPVLLVFVVSGCGDSPEASTSISQKTEVIIVGTQHLITDMPDGYTPAHLRAMLAEIKPDIIAIEAATNVETPMSTAPYECTHVTAPWAMSNDIPIAAVGILEPEYRQQNASMLQKFRNEGTFGNYEQAERDLAQKIELAGSSCESINGSRYQQAWREYHTTLHKLNGGATPWETWNAKVVRKIRKLCDDHAGKRIAVVFGGTHSYLLSDLLKQQDDMKVVSTEAFVSASESEIREHTERLDYLKAMRPLNLDQVQPSQLAHAHKLLEHIKGVPSLEDDYKLFHGKYLMHSGEFREAITTFDQLARSVGNKISKFDGQSRIVDGARLGAVLTFAKAGQPADARKLLEQIIGDSASSEEVRGYAKQLLSNISDVKIDHQQAAIQ